MRTRTRESNQLIGRHILRFLFPLCAAHLTAGSTFHAALQTYFQTKEPPAAKSPLSDVWTSVTSALANIHDEPELIEAPIVHPILQYKGIVDCVSAVK